VKRASRYMAVLLCCGALLLAQEGGASSESGGSMLGWMWANFAILAAGLGYLIAKNAPALFRKRAEEIQQGIQEATRTKKDAEARAASIELRLAGLQTEIASLRAGVAAEMDAERQRISRDTEQRLQKIQQQAQQEITLMSRGAREELRRYSADLAINLAQQRIQSRMTPDTQQALVDSFVHDLHARQQPGSRN